MGRNETILPESRKFRQYILNGDIMIFVTVGTHEQPFDRLIQYIDEMAEKRIFSDEFILQTGFCRYIPKFCVFRKFFSYEDMIRLTESARIVITHGGPASVMMSLEREKIPIVVPRQKKFGEHVNDHQIFFVREFSKNENSIIAVENMDCLEQTLLDYDSIVKDMPRTFIKNNAAFCQNMERIAQELLK